MKKRIWGSLLLAGLVLLSSRSAVAETTRQESDRHPSILNVETVGHD